MLVLSGGGRHVEFLSIEQLYACFKFIWFSLFFAILAVAFAKCSVAVFILELFGRTSFRRRWILYAAFGVTMVSAILNAGLVLGQCQPVSALWSFPVEGTCWKSPIILDFCYCTACMFWVPSQLQIYNLWTAIFTAMDFLLAFLPVTFVWRLKMSRKKRLSLCLLLGTGVVYVISSVTLANYRYSFFSSAGVFSAIKTFEFKNFNSTLDFTCKANI